MPGCVQEFLSDADVINIPDDWDKHRCPVPKLSADHVKKVCNALMGAYQRRVGGNRGRKVGEYHRAQECGIPVGWEALQEGRCRKPGSCNTA